MNTSGKRKPWLYIVPGVLSAYWVLKWLQELHQTGQITVLRGGSPAAAYSGPLAILVIATLSAFGLTLLVIGVGTLIKNGRSRRHMCKTNRLTKGLSRGRAAR